MISAWDPKLAPGERSVEVREQFGGIDLAATLGGMLAGLGAVLLMAVVVTAAGVAGSGTATVDATGLTVAGVIAAVVIATVGCGVGGWVAGRASRYDGAGNGILAALALFIVLALSVGAGGSAFTDADGVLGTDLLRGYDPADVGWAALGSGLGALLIGVIAGAIGGRIGDGYHRRADHVLTRPVDAVSPTDEPRSISGAGATDLAQTDDRRSVRR